MLPGREAKTAVATIMALFKTRLTLGQPRVRWLAIEKSVLGRHVDDKHRETMLRTDDCCEECALDHVASLPGRWALIL